MALAGLEGAMGVQVNPRARQGQVLRTVQLRLSPTLANDRSYTN